MESATLVRVLKALSEPTRLRILELLMQGSHCNCEVAEALDLSMSLVSHHLRVLVEAGLVVSERCQGDSRWIAYTIDVQVLHQVSQAICHLLDDGRVQTRQPHCGSWRAA
jgi:ArsR family transcriptional regulator